MSENTNRPDSQQFEFVDSQDSEAILIREVEELEGVEQYSQVLRDRGNSSFESNSSNQRAKSPSIFKKFPRLNKYFIKQGKETNCVACGTIQNTVEICRIMSHVKKCKRLDDDQRDELIQNYENLWLKKKDTNTTINEAWANFMVDNNVSMQSVDSRSFRQFAKLCNSKWRYADRHKISADYIPVLSRNIKKNFGKLAKKYDSFMSVEFDHWTDLTSRSLLGVVFTLSNGNRYLQALIDVSVDGHSAQTTTKHLLSTLSTIPAPAINSMVSDSASCCRLTRELMVEKQDYKHVIQHRCVAHLINNIGTMISEDEHIKESFTWASKIVNFVSHSAKLLAMLNESGHTRPKKACKVRWYSTINMVESLLEAKDFILEAVDSGQELTRANCEWMKQECHWLSLDRAQKVLRPLTNSIAIAERKNGSLGEAVGSLMRYARDLFMSDWREPLIVGSIAAFLTYFGPNKLGHEEFALMLAAYILDRRHKCDFMTEEGLDLAHDAIMTVAHKTKYSIASINEVIAEEYSNFCVQQGQFSKYQQLDQASESWWNEISACSGLRPVATRIARLRSSSANIERAFSSLKHIQGSKRTNLSIETLTHLARIKIYEEFEPETEEIDSKDSDEEEEEADSQRTSLSTNLTQEVNVCEPSDFDYQQGSTAHYVPQLFDVDIRKAFDTFTTYVDFSIVNELMMHSEDTAAELTVGKKAELKEKSRSIRERIKSAKANAVNNLEPTEGTDQTRQTERPERPESSNTTNTSLNEPYCHTG